jgi:GntR family transcriptional regulator, histidine utilization repressor
MAAKERSKRRTGTLSLHQRILSDIEADILSGAWPPGHRIPFEHELTAQYRCSRMTVNKALTQLAAAGLIERRRKVGSFVRRPQSQSAILQIPDIGAEVRALGLPYSFEILARRKRRVARSDSERIDLPAADWLLDLQCRHVAGARPFCIEERLISLAAVPEAEAEAFADEPPGTWLARRVPWTNAEHRIHAVGADASIAARCKVSPGTPCLVVERRTWSAKQPVTFVRLTYPGEAHQLIASFTPSQTAESKI